MPPPHPCRKVVVFGGNAFLRPGQRLSMAGQFHFAKEAVSQLGPLVQDGIELLVSHGNGPQVGHMLLRAERALPQCYALPLEVCVAETEGELGYVLQQTLYNLFAAQHRPRPVVSLLTQVVVDERDPAFDQPTKPIGPFYDEDRARTLLAEGLIVKEEPGRGWRKVVPSPQPLEVVELPVIQQLLAAGVVVIAAGGGGIPVVRRNEQLQGIEAVIDKDLAAALMGEQVGATQLIILSGVPCVYLDFGRSGQRRLAHATPDEALELLAAGHFAPGSMAPKVRAAARFSRRVGCETIICDPPSLPEALMGRAGTSVSWDPPG